MTKLKRRVMLAALIVLVAASLLLYVPQVSAGRSTRALQRPVQFDFSLAVTPDTVTLRPGESAVYIVSVELAGSPAQEVSIEYTIPQVAGVSAGISRPKGTPPFQSTITIRTTTQTPPGTYTINIAAGGGGVERRTSVTVKVETAPPGGFDFSVTASPDSVSLRPGESASCTVSVRLIRGPAQEVYFVWSHPHELPRVTLSPGAGTPPFTSTFTITTEPSTTPGTYELGITVTPIGGGVEKTAVVTLTVTEAAGFDFSVKVSPSIVTTTPGESATYTVNVELTGGPAQEVSIMCTIPRIVGVSVASISRTKGTPPFTSTLKIATTTQTPPGTYTIIMAGAGGGVEKQATFTLTVTTATTAGRFDFPVDVEPKAVSLKAGESASYTVKIGPISGPADHPTIELSYRFTQAPPGVTGSFSTYTGDPPFASTLRITTTVQTPPGTYTIQISGIGGGLEKQASVTLTVTGGAPPGPTSTDWSMGDIWFTPSTPKPGDQVSFQAKLSALSSDRSFPQQVSVDVYVDGRLIGGGSILVPGGDVVVTVSPGSPWTATAGSHTVAFVVDPRNTYNDRNTTNNKRELSFSVAAAQPPTSFDFSVTVTPRSQSLIPEGSVVYDVYVDLTAGTSETVSLTLSGLPEDATYAFDPPTGLPYFPSTLTIYVPQYTAAGAPMPAGSHTLTVAVEGAGLVRTATTTLVVEAAGVVTSTQATVTSRPTSVVTTQAATQTAGGLGGGGIFLILLIVVVVAGAAYYVSRRRKVKPPSEPIPKPPGPTTTLAKVLRDVTMQYCSLSSIALSFYPRGLVPTKLLIL